MILIPKSEFDGVVKLGTDREDVLAVIGDMCRINTLTSVAMAGSGHLGSSFSAMEIYVWALYQELNCFKDGTEEIHRDIIFSSKGHDVPALYSVYYSLGIIPEAKFLQLRKLGGLPGHPDVTVPGIEANSGSLGMGISKARGRAWAKLQKESKGRVFVLVGDGELQEGQNYEALQGASSSSGCELTVIVDYNKIQSDKRVHEISYVGNLEKRFESFGWPVVRCAGHNICDLSRAYKTLAEDDNRLGVIIADTTKGKGVSFMEANADEMPNSIYQWHAGAPDSEEYEVATREIIERINRYCQNLKLHPPEFREIHSGNMIAGVRQAELGEQIPSRHIEAIDNQCEENLVAIFGQELVRLGRQRPDLVVFDADLAADLRLRQFEKEYPSRFIEVGIAEQDMVSMAGAVSREGFLPVVNSFGAFLASRANEQIYNNLTENSKVLYVCHYTGLIPAGPGKSHQSVRDISLFSAFPNLTIIQPGTGNDVIQLLEYFVYESPVSCMMRLPLGPSPQTIRHVEEGPLIPGRGRLVRRGNLVLFIAAGPLMLGQALKAANILEKKGTCSARVVNVPWRNTGRIWAFTNDY